MLKIKCMYIMQWENIKNKKNKRIEFCMIKLNNNIIVREIRSYTNIKNTKCKLKSLKERRLFYEECIPKHGLNPKIIRSFKYGN